MAAKTADDVRTTDRMLGSCHRGHGMVPACVAQGTRAARATVSVSMRTTVVATTLMTTAIANDRPGWRRVATIATHPRVTTRIRASRPTDGGNPASDRSPGTLSVDGTPAVASTTST